MSTTASIRAPEPRAVGRRRRRGRAALALAALAALAVGAAPAAEAALVVLTGGEVLKVRAYEVTGERARLELAAGGTMELALLRVERVVDDEIEESEPAVPEPKLPVSPLALRFSRGHGVPATPYGAEMVRAGERHDLNPGLLAAVVRAESSFRAGAVSHKGARGLMQLMPATASRFGVAPRELFEPARNLEAGARYLRWLLDRYDDELHLALAAYNAGEGAVDRFGGVPPYRETRRYVRRVYELFGVSSASGR